MVCSKDLKFPLHINLNLMFATPIQDLPKPILCPPEPWNCAVGKQDVALQVDASDLLSESESETEAVSWCSYPSIKPTCMSPVKLTRETQTHRTKTVHWSSLDPVISGKVLNTNVNKHSGRSPVHSQCSRSGSPAADVTSDSDEESTTELTKSDRSWRSTCQSQISATSSSTATSASSCLASTSQCLASTSQCLASTSRCLVSTSHCPPSANHSLARSSLSVSRSHKQASPSR